MTKLYYVYYETAVEGEYGHKCRILRSIFANHGDAQRWIDEQDGNFWEYDIDTVFVDPSILGRQLIG
jgi:hypothetical protein